MQTAKGVEVPSDLLKVLAADQEALRIFQGMRPSCQREYAEWVSEAKRETTRARRLASIPARIREYGVRHGMLDLVQERA